MQATNSYPTTNSGSTDNMLRQLIFVSIENRIEEVKCGLPVINYSMIEPGVSKEQHIIRVRDSVEAMLNSIENQLCSGKK